MASTDGGQVASGNESSFLDKLGNSFILGLNKKIDVELASDSKNMPDQNDLVWGFHTSKNSQGRNVSGVNPQMLLIGAALLLVSIFVIKKVL